MDGAPVIDQSDETKIETYDEKNQRELLEKESTPMRLTNFFVRCPCCCLVMSFIILIWLTNVAFAGDMFSLADSNGRDFLVWTDVKVQDDDMRNIARQYITDQSDVVVDEDGKEEEIAVRSKFAGFWGMTFIWKNVKNKEYGLLLKSNLVKMEKVERMINTTEEFFDYCVA